MFAVFRRASARLPRHATHFCSAAAPAAASSANGGTASASASSANGGTASASAASANGERPVPPSLQAWVHTMKKERKEIIEIHPEVFGQALRRDILQRVVRWHLAAKRGVSTANTKGRGDVRGGGRKPHPQKGQGRARQGSIRSPLNRGGGHIHPKVQRDFSYNLPQKVRHLGLKVALSARFMEGNLFIVDNVELQSHKTKHFVALADELDLHNTLIVVDQEDSFDNLKKATGNLKDVVIVTSNFANVFDILKNRNLVITQKAVAELEQRLVKSKRRSYGVDGEDDDSAVEIEADETQQQEEEEEEEQQQQQQQHT